jgi:hypothetical protein
MAGKLDSTKWLHKKIAEFKKENIHYQTAALLHIYIGSLTIKEIAEISSMNPETISGLRRNPGFMRLVDNLKKEYSRDVREDLLVNNYHFDEYYSLASDFSLFEDMLQMQIKVPLFTYLKEVSQSIKNKRRYNLAIDMYDLKLFYRLFSFFILIEKYSSTLTSKSLMEMKQIAEEIVWPLLNLDKNEIDCFLNKPVSTRNERLKEIKEKMLGIVGNKLR